MMKPILKSHSFSREGMTTPETVVPTEVIAVHGDVAEERSIDPLNKTTSLDSRKDGNSSKSKEGGRT
jgi:hypothetical protein